LTFNPLRALVMIYTHAKVEGQWSVGSEDRVETKQMFFLWQHSLKCKNSFFCEK